MVESIIADVDVRSSLKLTTNSTTLAIANRLRIVQRRDEPLGELFAIASVDGGTTLQEVISKARSGVVYDDLVASLIDEEVTRGDATQYVEQLIAAQVLVFELSLPVTGGTPALELCGLLPDTPVTNAVAKELTRAANAAQALACSEEPFISLDRYKEAVPKLPRSNGVDETVDLQIDLRELSHDLVLGQHVIHEAEQAVHLLHRLSDRPDSSRSLESFRSAFHERYGDRTIPFLVALDEEHGIGFGEVPDRSASPVLRNLAFERGELRQPSWTPRDEVLLELLNGTWRRGERELTLSNREIDALSGHPGPLPDAFAVWMSLYARSIEALELGDFTLNYHSSFGPSGANWLGRFCAGDKELTGWVRRHLKDEELQSPDVIFAEVVHLTGPRSGNVVCRPLLRDYEISVLDRSGIDADHVIPLDDLFLTVDSERVRLWSGRLGREVRPRVTSAVNYARNAVRHVEFLHALQHDGTQSLLQWQWGRLSNAPFLPRVVYGKVVLYPAVWLVRRESFGSLGKQSAIELYSAVQSLREELQLPRFIGVIEGDQVLSVDLDSILSIEAVAPVLQRRPKTRLVENPAHERGLCVTGPGGRFCHEILLPFTAKQQVSSAASAHRMWRPITVSLTPAFGREWIYAKLYCGSANADRILTDYLSPLLRSLGGDQLAHWFFVRFRDPEWHLRIRLRGTSRSASANIFSTLKELGDHLLDAGIIRRMQFDTYELEIDRYGGATGMELSHNLFHADSEAALHIVSNVPDSADTLRWLLTLRGLDQLLLDFGFDLEARASFAQARRQDLLRSLALAHRETRTPLAKELDHALSDNYREMRGQIEALFSAEPPYNARPGISAIQRRTDHLVPIIANLKEAFRSAKLRTSLPMLAQSYTHMFVNRVQRARHKEHELAAYDALGRLYRTLMARAVGQTRERGESISIAV